MIYQLSPMESVSCWAFRRLCTEFGADRTYTEMIRLKGLARNNKASWSLIDTFGGENCHVQLMAIKPKNVHKFFDRLEDKKKDKEFSFLSNINGYNLNLGCPSPDVIKEGGGAALMKRTSRVCDLLTALFERSDFPLSVKIRLGLNQKELDNKVYVNLLQGLSELSVSTFNEIIVHLKHGREKSADAFHYDLISEIRESWKKDLILNGGYHENHLPPSSVEGVMFARAAITDPRVFSNLKGKKVSYAQMKELFNTYCSLHPPKEKYINYLARYSKLLNTSL